MRNIKNINQINNHRDLTNGGDLNELTADLPLNLVEDPTGQSNDSINLGGLSSFGGTGKIMKVNSSNNGLEWVDDNNTEYTVVNPLTLSNQNAISLTGLSGFGEAGQVLRVTSGTNGLEYSDETVESATTPLVITNGVIKLNGLSGYGGGIGQSGKKQLIRTNANASALEYFDQPDFINSATLPLSISSSGVISLATTLTLDRLNITQGNAIYLKGDNDLNHYIKYSSDGVEVAGYGYNNAACFQVYSTGVDATTTPPTVPEILAYYFRNHIQFQKNLWLNQKAIYFYLDVNGLDSNHYIKYDGRASTSSQVGCNGVQVGGYGAQNRACFEVITTQTNPNAVLFQVCPDQLVAHQKLVFTDPSVTSQNNYIKYNDTYDSMEISGNGLGSGNSVLRIVSPNSAPDVLADFELTKTTIQKPTTFNSAVTVSSSLYVNNTLTASSNLAVGTSMTVAEDITIGAVDRNVYFTPDLINRIKATSTDVTGGGMLITGYDTVRLAEQVNSSRYVELNNDSFTVSDCNLIMDDYSKAFTCPKATFSNALLNVNGRASICNTRIVNANGIVQIDCGRSPFSLSQSIDGMAIRKGTGGHLVNFVKYDNTGNLGQIRATNTNVFYDQSSDRRLKTNITDMRSMIDKIMELRPREYNWIADNESDYGFIAQEVHETFPHMREDVNCYCGEEMNNMDMNNPVDKDGEPIYFGVDYGRFTPYLVKAMQEQQVQIDKQQAQIDRQQAQIEMLLEKFNMLT